MSAIFAASGEVAWQDVDQQQSLWSYFRKLSSPARVRAETWEHTRLHVRQALDVINAFDDETLDCLGTILQDISTWNSAVTTKVNESALNLVELYVTLLISMAPEVRNLPPEVFEQLADNLREVRDLVENRSRLSLTQRYIRRKQFRKEITIHRNALIDVLKPCASSAEFRRNFILESQKSLSLSTISAPRSISSSSDDSSLNTYVNPVLHRPHHSLSKMGSPSTTVSRISTSSDEEITRTPEAGTVRHLPAVLHPEVPSQDSTTTKAEVSSAPTRDAGTNVTPSDEASSPETRTPSRSHFPFIYLPEKSSPPLTAPALRCEDVTTLEREFSEGGVAVSVYSPDAALSWLESHYDDPLLEALRSRDFQGPIAMQLAPTESALVVFGSIADAMIPQLAKALAHASGFAVMVRSSVDNPLLSFAKANAAPPKSPHTVSTKKRPPVSTELAAGAEQLGTLSRAQPAARLRGGGADPDDDVDTYDGPEKWEGACHRATVDLELKLSDEIIHAVTITSRIQFQTQPKNDSNPAIFRPRPEVLSRVSMEVQVRRTETMLDHSFSNLGFLVHRPRSIEKCDFLGLEQVTKLKDTTQKSRVNAITVGLAGFSQGRSKGDTEVTMSQSGLEATDEKPMPKCELKSNVGKNWEYKDAEKSGKDFGSYDVAWRPVHDQDNIQRKTHAEFGLGMNLRHDKRLATEGMPPISFILRNQILLWVYDPNRRTKVRGILLLTSTYIPDARTDQRFDIDTTSTVNFSQDPVIAVSPSEAPDDEAAQPIAISVSVAPLDKSKKRRPLFEKFRDRLPLRASPPKQDAMPDLPMYEAVSRGWDATNMRWRSVIWPTLDHEFHGVPDNSEKAAWKLRWATEPGALPEVGSARRVSGVPEVPSQDFPAPKSEVPPAPRRASGTDIGSEGVSSPERPSTRTTSHFPIIYPPGEASALPSAPAFRCEDATTLESEFADGGVTVSVYSPDDAVSWLESHYEDPLLELFRERNFQGPIAVQLGPGETALAVFGSIADAEIPQLAKALAEASGFAVMVRSSIDNPLLDFAQTAIASEKPSGSTQPRVLTSEPPTPVATEQPAARLRGGAADPDDEADEYYCYESSADSEIMLPEWEGPRHTAKINLTLKLGDAKYDVEVSSDMKFETQPLGQTLHSPEVLAFVSLKVKLCRGETSLDRSFSNLGFLVHRSRSILLCDFLDLGYEPPDIKLKRTAQKSNALTAGAGISVKAGVPTVSANVAYTRNWGNGLEAADEKPMPKCKVQYDRSRTWEREDANKLGKDFRSYDVQWRPEPDRDNVAHEMQVEFGLGMCIVHDKRLSTEGIPAISSVLRNQILVWVSDPGLQSKGRGILLLTSTYIPNAQTDKRLTLIRSTTVNLNQDPPVRRAVNPVVAADDEGMKHAEMSVSVAPLDKAKKRRPPSMFRKIFDKLALKPDVTHELPMYETGARGWDAKNMRWRSIIWPTLDDAFHGVPDNSKKATWKLGWTPDPAPVPSTSATGSAPTSSADPIPAVVVSPPITIPNSNAPIGLSKTSSNTTEVSDTAQTVLFDPDGGQDTTTIPASIHSSFLGEPKKS